VRPGASTRWLRAGRLLSGIALVAYPLLVWFGLAHGSPRHLALLLLCVLLPAVALRLRGSRRAAPSADTLAGGLPAGSPRGDGLRGMALLPLVTVAALVLAAVLDARGWVLAVPVVINALLLLGFAATLRRGALPMIERFARLQVPELSPEQQAWCRTWTVIWCAFFVLNGGTALLLALAAPLAWWTLYNGLVAYALIGALLATEWLLRRRRFGPGA
jgi:uncharacterized membrane protein